MRILLHKFLVFLAFSFLLAHNFVPHHHHHGLPEQEHHHHGEDESDHHHYPHPFTFHSIDEVFLSQPSWFQLTIPAVTGQLAALLPDLDALPIGQHPVLVPVPDGYPPPLPFLKAQSFRGPPAV